MVLPQESASKSRGVSCGIFCVQRKRISTMVAVSWAGYEKKSLHW